MCLCIRLCRIWVPCACVQAPCVDAFAWLLAFNVAPACGWWFGWHCVIYRWRPYRVECTGSLPTSEVKRRRARLVLGWGTAREDLRVLPAFGVCINAIRIVQWLFYPGCPCGCRCLSSTSAVAQWLACWAHNPKVRGSKPRCAISRLSLCGALLFSLVWFGSLSDMVSVEALGVSYFLN